MTATGKIRGASGGDLVGEELLGPVEPVVRLAAGAGRACDVAGAPGAAAGQPRPAGAAGAVAAGLTTACRTCAGTPYAAETRSTRPANGTPRPLGEGQVGFHQQAPQDHRRPGLHEVEHPRHQRASHPAAEQPGHVDEQPLAGVGVHRRPGAAVGDGGAEQGRRRTEPRSRKDGQAHRRDGPVEALGDAEAEVDAACRSRRRRVGRERVERRDRSGLDKPQRARRRRWPTRCPAARRGAARPGRPARRAARSWSSVRQGRSGDVGARRASCRRRDGAGWPAACRRSPLHDGAAVGVDDEVVGVDRAGHHRLAEARGWRR